MPIIVFFAGLCQHHSGTDAPPFPALIATYFFDFAVSSLVAKPIQVLWFGYITQSLLTEYLMSNKLEFIERLDNIEGFQHEKMFRTTDLDF